MSIAFRAPLEKMMFRPPVMRTRLSALLIAVRRCPGSGQRERRRARQPATQRTCERSRVVDLEVDAALHRLAHLRDLELDRNSLCEVEGDNVHVCGIA